jgi:hypothetical protein
MQISPDRFLPAPILRRIKYRLLPLGLAALAPLSSLGQQPDVSEDRTPSKHVLWVVPNFRTSPVLQKFEPLTPGQKFTIAAQDTFDRGTFVLAALFAGENQLGNSNPSFGQGVKGYAQYGAASYADFAIGNYMTEGIFPTLLHQDPRYFRQGSGSAWSRLGSAVGQIFWTHTDSGGRQFNYSEIAGNSTAVAISTAYYSGDRSVSEAVSQLGIQVGVDMATNIVKEFWPDRPRKRRAGKQ